MNSKHDDKPPQHDETSSMDREFDGNAIQQLHGTPRLPSIEEMAIQQLRDAEKHNQQQHQRESQSNKNAGSAQTQSTHSVGLPDWCARNHPMVPNYGDMLTALANSRSTEAYVHQTAHLLALNPQLLNPGTTPLGGLIADSLPPQRPFDPIRGFVPPIGGMWIPNNARLQQETPTRQLNSPIQKDNQSSSPYRRDHSHYTPATRPSSRERSESSPSLSAGPSKVGTGTRTSPDGNGGRLLETTTSAIDLLLQEIPRPSRQLTAYNIFFKHERQRLLDDIASSNKASTQITGDTQSKSGLSFTSMGKLIGAKWKQLSCEEKAPFQEEAAVDKLRYKKEMAQYKAKKDEAMLSLHEKQFSSVEGSVLDRYYTDQAQKALKRRKKPKKEKQACLPKPASYRKPPPGNS